MSAAWRSIVGRQNSQYEKLELEEYGTEHYVNKNTNKLSRNKVKNSQRSKRTLEHGGARGPTTSRQNSSSLQLDKRSIYEPTQSQRLRQVVCSQRKAFFLCSMAFGVILVVAFIAAFANSSSQPCSSPPSSADSSSSSSSDTGTVTESSLPFDSFRLPDCVSPLTYDIFLNPDLATFAVNGSVVIQLVIREKTNFIVFHVKNLTVSDVSIAPVSGAASVSISQKTPIVKHEQYYIKMNTEMVAQARYNLTVKFNGNLQASPMTGFYKSSYKTTQNETRWIATTQFESTYARQAFPCFDEPLFKARFRLSIVRTKNRTTLFNSPLETTEDPYENSDVLVRDQYEYTVKMSTYLVAFLVMDFHNISGTVQTTPQDSVKVSVHAASQKIDQANLALNASKLILKYYVDFFNMTYPLKKLDVVAVPDFEAGAIENWGLITYRETTVLYDPNKSSINSAERVVIVIAHELAHQWFGNYVTMNWWNDLWLNEGFASFMEYKGANKFAPEWRMMDMFAVDTAMKALDADSLNHSHPIKANVSTSDQIASMFDGISYDKGAALIYMLETYLGEKTLRKGLAKYLQTYQYSNAATNDLWNRIDQVLQESNEPTGVKEMMGTWTVQKGYPLVNVAFHNKRKVKLTQKHFVLNGTAQTQNMWSIPLTYITQNDRSNVGSGVYYVNQSNYVVDTTTNFGQWIKVNVNQTGFYRVNYSESLWKGLIKQLEDDPDVFSAADRANLIDDAFSIARAGWTKLNVTIALNLTKYAKQKEDAYTPWRVILHHLYGLMNTLNGYLTRSDLQDYVKDFLKPMVDKLGWGEKNSHLETKKQALILKYAVELGQVDAVKKGRELFDKWKNDGVAVPKNLQHVIYNAGVQYGNTSDWEFVYEKYKEEIVPSVKADLRAALCTTTDPNLLSVLLQWSLDSSKFKSQDTVGIIAGIAENPGGHYRAWEFVEDHWDKLSDRYEIGSFAMRELFAATTWPFNTVHRHTEVRDFFEDKRNGSLTRGMRQSLEKILLRASYANRIHDTVQTWLEKNA